MSVSRPLSLTEPGQGSRRTGPSSNKISGNCDGEPRSIAFENPELYLVVLPVSSSRAYGLLCRP